MRIELKYCERCGGLWLRHEGNPQVYCVRCLPEMAQVARGHKKQPTSANRPDLREGVACA
jgi:Zn-finger nucleic acid-binding protein